MEKLQIIGFGAIMFIIYRFIYVPYISNKEDEKKIVEEKIKILSSSHRDMRELFQPHIQPVYETDLDGNTELGTGWAKAFNRLLYFSTDSELHSFKAQALSLYYALNANPQSKMEIEAIFKEHKDHVEKRHIEKANKYLELRKNFLDYKKVMSAIFLNSENLLESEEIVMKLSERLQLSNIDSIKLFEKLSHHNTGIIFWSGQSKAGKGLYRYDESFIDSKTISDIR